MNMKTKTIITLIILLTSGKWSSIKPTNAQVLSELKALYYACYAVEVHDASSTVDSLSATMVEAHVPHEMRVVGENNEKELWIGNYFKITENTQRESSINLSIYCPLCNELLVRYKPNSRHTSMSLCKGDISYEEYYFYNRNDDFDIEEVYNAVDWVATQHPCTREGDPLIAVYHATEMVKSLSIGEKKETVRKILDDCNYTEVIQEGRSLLVTLITHQDNQCQLGLSFSDNGYLESVCFIISPVVHDPHLNLPLNRVLGMTDQQILDDAVRWWLRLDLMFAVY